MIPHQCGNVKQKTGIHHNNLEGRRVSQVTGNMLAKELIEAYLGCTYENNERSGKKVSAYVEYEQNHFK